MHSMKMFGSTFLTAKTTRNCFVFSWWKKSDFYNFYILTYLQLIWEENLFANDSVINIHITNSFSYIFIWLRFILLYRYIWLWISCALIFLSFLSLNPLFWAFGQCIFLLLHITILIFFFLSTKNNKRKIERILRINLLRMCGFWLSDFFFFLVFFSHSFCF